MQLSIYLWLSCVALAGYVRATEETTSVPVTEGTIQQRDEPLASDKDLFIDDDGSGLEIDESSGSGWGPGPGPDDEDGRGSGDAPHPGAPEDDEDFTPRRITTTLPPVPETEPSDTDRPIPVDSFDVVGPRVLSKPSEGAPDIRPEEPQRPDQTDISISGEDINPNIDQDQSSSNVEPESRPSDNSVFIMNAKPEDRATSFFAQPGILAAVIGGAVVGLLCAILVVMFIVYRMRKKDEGSYALDEPKRSPAAASYGKGHNNREFYA
ncbi:syndecan isoform X1 [Danaus plexippus]|uniref:syndecan isoform X1 n=1 Tax=Danaus plexippus TaxID=13037 RepID=UPI0013C417B8|nr:syndecan isoform X1 [Danaus plexippus]